MIYQKKIFGQLSPRQRWGVFILMLLLLAGLGVLSYSIYPQARKSAPPVLPPQSKTVPEESGPAEPGFDVIRVTKEGRAVMAGRAEPGARVVLKSGGRVLGETLADKRGDWVLVPDDPLPPGAQVITLFASKGDGATVISEDSGIILVPERPDGDVFVAISRPGTPTRILDQGQAEKASPGLSLAGVDMEAEGETIFSGRAAAGAQVRVYLDNQLVGETAADGNGDWTVQSANSLKTGPHLLRVDQIDESATVQMRSEVAFTRTDAGKLVIGQRQVIVLKGNALWEIARNIYGSGMAYSVIFTNNSEQIRDPDLIYPGQVLRIPGESGVENPPADQDGAANTFP
jgi:nucleoid-associated protein YgaU